MAYVNVEQRVIEAKIVYYGAAYSGKTTNLEQIRMLSSSGHAGAMMSIANDGDRTLFFDWLPVDVGNLDGYAVKIHVYTVPGQPKHVETRRKVLAAADGVVLVLDSDEDAVERNRIILEDLRIQLRANGLDPYDVPIVLQSNKRDLPTALPTHVMLSEVGLPDWPSTEAVASQGKGVIETLRKATSVVLESVLDSVRESARAATRPIEPPISNGLPKAGAKGSGLDGESLFAQLVQSAQIPLHALMELPSASDSPRVLTLRPGEARPASPRSFASLDTEMLSFSYDGLATEHVKLPSAVAAPAASSVEHARPSPQEELLEMQRTTLKRIERLETSMTQGVAEEISEAERRIVARAESAAREAAEGVSRSAVAAVQQAFSELRISLDQRVSELRDELKNESGRPARENGDKLPSLESLAFDCERMIEEVRGRLDDLAPVTQIEALGMFLSRRIQEVKANQLPPGAFEEMVASATAVIAREFTTRIAFAESRVEVAVSGLAMTTGSLLAAIEPLQRAVAALSSEIANVEKRVTENTAARIAALELSREGTHARADAAPAPASDERSREPGSGLIRVQDEVKREAKSRFR